MEHVVDDAASSFGVATLHGRHLRLSMHATARCRRVEGIGDEFRLFVFLPLKLEQR